MPFSPRILTFGSSSHFTSLFYQNQPLKVKWIFNKLSSETEEHCAFQDLPMEWGLPSKILVNIWINVMPEPRSCLSLHHCNCRIPFLAFRQRLRNRVGLPGLACNVKGVCAAKKTQLIVHIPIFLYPSRIPLKWSCLGVPLFLMLRSGLKSLRQAKCSVHEHGWQVLKWR